MKKRFLTYSDGLILEDFVLGGFWSILDCIGDFICKVFDVEILCDFVVLLELEIVLEFELDRVDVVEIESVGVIVIEDECDCGSVVLMVVDSENDIDGVAESEIDSEGEFDKEILINDWEFEFEIVPVLVEENVAFGLCFSDCEAETVDDVVGVCVNDIVVEEVILGLLEDVFVTVGVVVVDFDELWLFVVVWVTVFEFE